MGYDNRHGRLLSRYVPGHWGVVGVTGKQWLASCAEFTSTSTSTSIDV